MYTKILQVGRRLKQDDTSDLFSWLQSCPTTRLHLFSTPPKHVLLWLRVRRSLWWNAIVQCIKLSLPWYYCAPPSEENKMKHIQSCDICKKLYTCGLKLNCSYLWASCLMQRRPCSSWQAETLRWARHHGGWRGWGSPCCSTAQQPDASATKGRSAAGHPDSQHEPPERQSRGFWMGETFEHIFCFSRLHSGNHLVHGWCYLLNSNICRQHLWTFLCHTFIEHCRK